MMIMMNVSKTSFGMRTQEVLLSIMILAVVGCQASYKDKSDSIPYTDIVGKRFKTNVSVTAYGVDKSLNRDGPTDYVELRSELIEGPEVAFSKQIDKDTVITIERVLVADRLWQIQLKYQVSTSDGGLDDYQVILPAPEDYENGNYGLNANVFTEVKAAGN